METLRWSLSAAVTSWCLLFLLLSSHEALGEKLWRTHDSLEDAFISARSRYHGSGIADPGWRRLLSDHVTRDIMSETLLNKRPLTAYNFMDDSASYISFSNTILPGNNFLSARSRHNATLELDLELPSFMSMKSKAEVSSRCGCSLTKQNPFLPMDTLSKYSHQITVLSGHCCGDFHQTLKLVISHEVNESASVSGIFESDVGEIYYIDPLVLNFTLDGIQITPSVIYNRRSYNLHSDYQMETEFSDAIEENTYELKRFSNLRPKIAQVPKLMKFRLVIIAHEKYSDYNGGILSKVIASLIVVLDRLNSIFLREIGIHFELIPNFDQAICLPVRYGQRIDPACDLLPADKSISISLFRSSIPSFLLAKNITYDSYDIGHGFTRLGGGLSSMPGLCTAQFKATTATGTISPLGDPFTVDYVAHEMGHQLLGGHTFRDCSGEDGVGFMPKTAVEPGSGTSILGYPGLCGNRDLQNHADAYFNNLVQKTMRDYVLGVQRNATCGTGWELDNETLPQVSAVKSCKVPIGNPFQLSGTSDNNSTKSLFSWDRIDTGFEDLFSSNGMFRSFPPTAMKSRFFPNMQTLIKESIVSFEVLPKIPVNMTFRFTERRPYFFNGINFYNFGNADTIVQFVQVSKPLRVILPGMNSSYIHAGQDLLIEWEYDFSDDIASYVDVLITINKLPKLPAVVQSFVYGQYVSELDWLVIETIDILDGYAEIEVPHLSEQPEEILLMVRSSSSIELEESESCFFFDLVTDLVLMPTNTSSFY